MHDQVTKLLLSVAVALCFLMVAAMRSLNHPKESHGELDRRNEDTDHWSD